LLREVWAWKVGRSEVLKGVGGMLKNMREWTAEVREFLREVCA
jgi:hypothetical protein